MKRLKTVMGWGAGQCAPTFLVCFQMLPASTSHHHSASLQENTLQLPCCKGMNHRSLLPVFFSNLARDQVAGRLLEGIPERIEGAPTGVRSRALPPQGSNCMCTCCNVCLQDKSIRSPNSARTAWTEATYDMSPRAAPDQVLARAGHAFWALPRWRSADSRPQGGNKGLPVFFGKDPNVVAAH